MAVVISRIGRAFSPALHCALAFWLISTSVSVVVVCGAPWFACYFSGTSPLTHTHSRACLTFPNHNHSPSPPHDADAGGSYNIWLLGEMRIIKGFLGERKGAMVRTCVCVCVCVCGGGGACRM